MIKSWIRKWRERRLDDLDFKIEMRATILNRLTRGSMPFMENEVAYNNLMYKHLKLKRRLDRE